MLQQSHTIFPQTNHVYQNHLPLENKDEQKLERLVNKSHRIFLTMSTVFPFDLFPDTVTIDESKVNVIQKEFFSSDAIHGIPIKNIRDLELDTNLFFATMKIIPDGYPGNPIVIKFLERNKALKARRIIQGLIVSIKEGIDLSKCPNQNLVEKLEELGRINSTE